MPSDFDLKKNQDDQWTLHAPNLTLMTRRTVFAQARLKEPDAILNIETHVFNVMLVSDSCDYTFDVGKELHLNIGRWSRLVKEYLPKDQWERFKGQAREILTGKARHGATASMFFRDPDRFAKKHRWGGCLMGATFRGDIDRKPTLTFYSRTTYIGYMGLLDVAMAHVMAREITKGLHKSSPSDISFRWYISSMQLHSFKTLPYIYSRGKMRATLKTWMKARWDLKLPRDRFPPFWWHATKWQKGIQDGWHLNGKESMTTQKYGPLKRVIRRWAEKKGYLRKNLPKSLPVSELTFDKAI